jgi:hypothetical protein
MNIFSKFKAYLRLREAVIQADKAHAKDGARYYVIPAANEKLLITDRKHFRILKQKGYIHRDRTVTDLIAFSFYFTPYKDGSRALSPDYAIEKREAYFRWVDNCRKTKKTKKEAK